MKRAIAMRWVAALRSGKYTQGRGQLRVNTRYRGKPAPEFCCLGVLCELARKEVGGKWRRSTGSSAFVDECDRHGSVESHHTPPASVTAWAGMRDPNPMAAVEDGNDMRTLAEINDDGATFAEIADVIEKQWKSL